jgi:outer membrane protein assembly factor BamD
MIKTICFIKNFLFVILITVLFSCSNDSTKSVEVGKTKNAFKLHEKSKKALKSGNYRSAVESLERLDGLYPYGPYSHQAQLSLIYAYYKLKDYDKGLASAERFIRQNPQHKDSDYAYYMKGLINYSTETGFGKELFSAPVEERDSGSTREAFDNFAELLRRYPKSKYVLDAKKRMIYLRNRLAKYELYVANYYMKREAYHAVLRRAKYVIDHYPKTPSVPYALKMMYTAYQSLDLPEFAERTRRILLLNHKEAID